MQVGQVLEVAVHAVGRRVVRYSPAADGREAIVRGAALLDAVPEVGLVEADVYRAAELGVAKDLECLAVGESDDSGIYYGAVVYV